MISLKCWCKGHNYGLDDNGYPTSLRYCLRYNCQHQQYYDRRKGWVTLTAPTKSKQLASVAH